MKGRGQRYLGALLAVTLLVSALAVGAAVAQDSATDPDDIDYDADAVPNPEIETTVTVDEHEVGWDETQYRDNSGDVASLPGQVNSSAENPVTLTATDINVSEFTEFPHSEDHTWTNSSRWSTEGGMSVSETETAPDVDALNFATDGSMSNGDEQNATFSNVSVHSDEERRFLAVAADVNTLNADSHGEIRVNDTDGDYVRVELDPDNSTSTDGVLANSTGEGQVAQVQMGDLTVRGSGDGTFDDIEEVVVVAQDDELDVDVALLNIEKMSAYQFGEQRYDSDGDGDEDDTQTLEEPSGSYSITGTDTLGSAFDDATLRNVQVDMVFAASDLSDSDDALVEFEEADAYPSFDWIGTYNARLELPDAYALSYSSSELILQADLPTDRYETVQVAEAVDGDDFGNISDSDWTDYTDTIEYEEEVVLDNTIAAGEEIAVQTEQLVTEDEKESTFADSGDDDGGAVGPTGDSGGGIIDFLMSPLGWLVSGISALAGIKLIGR